MSEINFEKRRVEQALYARLKAATDELSEKSGQTYDLAKALFGKLSVAIFEGLVIAVVCTSSRPSKVSIVGVDADGTTYLPVIREGDIELMAERFSCSPEGVQYLRALAKGDGDDMR